MPAQRGAIFKCVSIVPGTCIIALPWQAVKPGKGLSGHPCSTVLREVVD